MKTIIAALLLISFASPALAGGLVYRLDDPGTIYKVDRDGDTTKVFNLGPGEPQVTIGRKLPSGNQMVITSPTYPRDDFAAGLAVDGEDRDESD
jgi:hypothetical protein